MSSIVEKRFEYKGYPCVVLFLPSCWRCGYVGIPKKDYLRSQISKIECHGGITYIESFLYGQEDKDIVWIGFDCAHYRDGYDYETGRKYYKDDPKTLESIDTWEKIHSQYPFDDYYFGGRTLEYVESECKHIVDQITAEVEA